MNNVTVLTTTYNRAELLMKLYKSLCEQDCQSFEWLIVDDGSTDKTKDVIRSLIQDKHTFDIKYVYKENGGKHTALNYAYKYIKTPLTFIVDSDDSLTSDAISCIEKAYEENVNIHGLCGFSFLREKPEGGYLSTSIVPYDGMIESYVECRINRNIGGDMAEVWYTDCLREFMFPVFPGERFLGEDIVWIKMSNKYKMRFYNKAIYISNYLEGGLTNNRRKHNIKSPNGCVKRAEAFLDSGANMNAKIKAGLQYQIYGRFAGRKIIDLACSSSHKILFALLFFPSLLLYLMWSHQYKKEIING